MICPNCKNKIHDRTPACPYCGTAISDEIRNQAMQDAKKIESEKEKRRSEAEDFWKDVGDYSSISLASGDDLPYVVIQVTLKEKFLGTGSGNLTELEAVINRQAEKGYRLHTISTTQGGSKGMMGGDRIQATMIFEKIGYGKPSE